MKQSIIQALKSDQKKSVIRCLEVEYKESVEALFERVYLWSDEDNEFCHPQLELRYMIDDYWELVLQDQERKNDEKQTSVPAEKPY